MKLFILTLGSKQVALAAEHVVDVLPLGPVTPVPWFPRPLVGATHVKGAVAAVIDLDHLLNGQVRRPVQGEECLVLRAAGHEVVACCDEVIGTRQVGDDRRVGGSVRIGDQLIQLVDLDQLLAEVALGLAEAAARLEVNPHGHLVGATRAETEPEPLRGGRRR